MSRLSSRLRLAAGLARWIASTSLASALALVIAQPQPVATAAMQQGMKALALPDDLNRILAEHCGRPVLRWHWLCSARN